MRNAWGLVAVSIGVFLLFIGSVVALIVSNDSRLSDRTALCEAKGGVYFSTRDGSLCICADAVIVLP